MLNIFWIVYIVWFLSEIVLNRLLRSNGNDKKDMDGRSLLVIWIVIILAISIAVIIAPRFPFPIYSNDVFVYVGIAVIALGVFLRIAAVITLGKMLTVDVTIRQDHRLLTSGLYSIVRHPSYFASLLSFVGFGIALNNWASLLLLVIAVFSVFVHRMNIEEKVLIRQFGDEYRAYMKRTKRMIPFVY